MTALPIPRRSLLAALAGSTAAIAAGAASAVAAVPLSPSQFSTEFAVLLARYRRARSIETDGSDRTDDELTAANKEMNVAAGKLADYQAQGPVEAAELVRVVFENVAEYSPGYVGPEDLEDVTDFSRDGERCDLALLARAIFALGLDPFEHFLEPAEPISDERRAEIDRECAARREEMRKACWYDGLVSPDGRSFADMRGAEVDALALALSADYPLLPCGTRQSQATDAQKAAAVAVYKRFAAEAVVTAPASKLEA